MALAGLVAALAIPFLIFDSPSPAEGVETNGDDGASSAAADVDASPTTTAVTVVEADAEPNAVEVVIVSNEVGPDIVRLADQAGTWAAARSQAIADGLVESSKVLPPSNTNLALLPVVDQTPAPAAPVDPEPEPTPDPEPVDPDPTDSESTDETDADPAAPSDGEAVDPDPEPVDADDAAEPAPEPTEPSEEDPDEPEAAAPPEPEPEEPPLIEEELVDEPQSPTTPVQVDGRVPPPAGGPTGAQWDALRKCESTHNYRAISPSGLYRGAYQFSQQTWDWVAGIHQPHLVGIDPIDAEPAWQDVMAYTLYAMRGWDQWPICGKNLL